MRRAPRKLLLFVLSILLCGLPAGAQARSPNDQNFSAEFWDREAERGYAKQRRGLTLGLLGLASFGLTAYLVKKTVDDPRRYLAAATLSGISGLGMSIHGFASISVGGRQKTEAEGFAAAHRAGQANDLGTAQAQYLLDVRRVASTKMTIFGAVLALESAIALTQGIMLSVHRRRGDDLRGARMWPSYLIGGLLLPASGLIFWTQSKSLRQIKTEQAALNGGTSFAPYFDFNGRGGLEFGLSASGRF